jgi:hypothetical protein
MEKVQNLSSIQVLTPNGWQDFEGVSRTKRKESTHVFTNSGKVVECTPEHLIKTPLGFISARQLKTDDQIFTKDGLEYVNAVFTYDSQNEEYYYDLLEVCAGHEYYTNDIVSHNCQFLGSSGTLIDGATLKYLQTSYREPLHEAQGLAVYERPEKGRTYVCIADVSRGKGLDYSAFHIVDVTQMPYRQVVTYRNNFVTPVDYADIIFRTTKSYNDAYILIEINDIGGQVSDTLHFDFEVDTLLYTESAGRSGKRISGGFGSNVDKGIRTTKQVKSVGCSVLKLLAEQKQLQIVDFNTINELSTFSRKGASYEAESGCHDDLVMGLVLFAWLTTQAFFKEITDINTMMKLREKSDEQLMDELLPFGLTYDDIEPVEPIYTPTRSGWMNGW